ncbi:MAG TPA: hypothetical protein VF657_05670 [Actinoplanes sp.]
MQHVREGRASVLPPAPGGAASRSHSSPPGMVQGIGDRAAADVLGSAIPIVDVERLGKETDLQPRARQSE